VVEEKFHESIENRDMLSTFAIKAAFCQGFLRRCGEMIVTCPDCDNKAKLHDGLAGETVRCPNCNAEFMSTGAAQLKYAGWGARFVAKIIDLAFMMAMAWMIEGLSRKLFPDAYLTLNAFNPVVVVVMMINMLLGIFYITWFVGKFGATPGKMAVKIKIVNPSGGKISYANAFGRYCGEFIVVFLTVMTGYLFGLFDPQKRTLHDRLCHTRVIAA